MKTASMHRLSSLRSAGAGRKMKNAIQKNKKYK
jgi:hypothetical protein